MKSHGFLSINKSSNTIDHILNELTLRSSESSSVGDIEGSVIGFSMLSMDTSDLNEVFICNFVELVFVLLKFWKLNVD